MVDWRRFRPTDFEYGFEASMRKKTRPQPLTEAMLDEQVIAQADDDQAWTKPVRVRKANPAAISLLPRQAEQAAYFARLHHERDLNAWIRRVVQERLDWEQASLTMVKRRHAKSA
jgi:hypothetical protein